MNDLTAALVMGTGLDGWGMARHGAYDAQLGVAYLLQALLHLGTVQRFGACRAADYTAR